jgi:hypothetical protein
VAQAIHNPIRCPSMCESPPDPPVALAQVRVCVLDAIDDLATLLDGIAVLDTAIEYSAPYRGKKFLLGAIDNKARGIKEALETLENQQWEAGR